MLRYKFWVCDVKPILGVKRSRRVFAYAESAQRPYLLPKTMRCSPTLDIGRENEPTGRASAPTLPDTSSMVTIKGLDSNLHSEREAISDWITGLSTLQLV